MLNAVLTLENFKAVCQSQSVL